MTRWAPLLLALAGCSTVPAGPDVAAPVGAIESPAQVEQLGKVVAGDEGKCRKLDRTLLKGELAAEGGMLQCFAVSKARRLQVDQLRGQLIKIAAELEKGCIR